MLGAVCRGWEVLGVCLSWMGGVGGGLSWMGGVGGCLSWMGGVGDCLSWMGGVWGCLCFLPYDIIMVLSIECWTVCDSGS